jgi:hypothetical protein
VNNHAHFDFNIGLSEEEKQDLQKMIGDFQQARRPESDAGADLASLQKQVEDMNKRLAYLTSMFLALDRRMKPLYEIIRLTFEKSELLNQRINAIINTLRSGDALK